MIKRAYAIGLLSFATLGFASLPAQAEQVSTQVTNQSAAAVGNGNYINQTSYQTNIQQRIRIQKGAIYSPIYTTTPQASYQEVQQNAGAVGNDNYIEQHSNQVNVQQQRINQGNKYRDRDNRYGKHENKGRHYGQYRDR
jgi:hypothetical protein